MLNSDCLSSWILAKGPSDSLAEVVLRTDFETSIRRNLAILLGSVHF